VPSPSKVRRACGTCYHCEHRDINVGLCRLNAPNVMLVQTPQGMQIMRSAWPMVHLDEDSCDKGWEAGDRPATPMKPVLTLATKLPSEHKTLH